MRQPHEHDQPVDVHSGSRPTVWFSSPLTIQEAALCSDLLLVDRNWRPLTDVMKMNIRLGAVLDFVDTVANTWMEGKDQTPPNYRINCTSEQSSVVS